MKIQQTTQTTPRPQSKGSGRYSLEIDKNEDHDNDGG